MTMTPGARADIASALAAERAAVEALVAVLAAEREALGGGQHNHLDRAAPRKRELLISLAAADQ